MDIKIPTRQFEKTPAWVQTLSGRKPFTEGNKIIRWHEVRDRVEDYALNRTVAETVQLYERIAGQPYTGTMTKKSIIIAAIKVWFPELPDALTLTDAVTWLKTRVESEAEWGLGCPAGCGRFWGFKGAPLRPADPLAVNPDSYLRWTSQPDGSITFTCDRCGEETRLSN